MFKLTPLITPFAMLAALTAAATPSFGQERYHGRENRSGQESGSAERARPRSEAPRTQGPGARAESPQQAAGTEQHPPHAQAPQQTPGADSQPRQPQRQAEQPRVEHRRYDGRDEVGRGVPRREAVAPRGEVIAPRGSYSPSYEPHYDSRYDPRYDPRYDRRYERRYDDPRYSPWVYTWRSYYRPYVFRPRYSLGFGLFCGYPVPYTYSYPYPITVYGHRAPRARVMIAPGSAYYGGVALEITPYDADVFVDGEYAGHVEDFDGTNQPLTLSSGTHQIEVQSPGYEPLLFNVVIQPGQVIPFRGDLRSY